MSSVEIREGNGSPVALVPHLAQDAGIDVAHEHLPEHVEAVTGVQAEDVVVVEEGVCPEVLVILVVVVEGLADEVLMALVAGLPAREPSEVRY